MDKRIEEMAKVIEEAMAKARRTLGGHNNIAMFYATMLMTAGYQKIPENAVVLTREELFRDSTQLSKEKQIEIIHNIILENLDYGYEETATAIYDANYRKIPKLGVILPFDHYDNLLKTDKQVRKETAEKFAEKLKNKAIRQQEFVGELAIGDIEYVKVKDIDEICKEITDKGVQNGD